MQHDELVMNEVADAAATAHAGDRAGARSRLLTLWERFGEGGDALHRVAIAHALADVQDDPAAQVSWDLRALAAAGELSDARVSEAGVDGGAASFLPSLHLNLADGYLKTGQLSLAADHAERGRAATLALRSNPYLEQIVAAFDRIEREIARPSCESVAATAKARVLR